MRGKWNRVTAAARARRAAACWCVAILLASAREARAGRLQGLRTDYEVGPNPFAVAVADLDQSGRVDLVSASYSMGSVTVLLDAGPGRFQPRQDFAVGTNPRAIGVADLSGDRRPDLVIANSGSNSVSVLTASPRVGYFAPKADYPCGESPRGLAIGDFNGDGAPDIVVANYFAATVTVLLNAGRGTFGPTATYVAGQGPNAVAAGDLTGDGRLDLAVTNSATGSLSILQGDGRGGFGTRTVHPIGTSPGGVAIGDVNGDGRADVVTANTGSNSVSVLFGLDGGGFTSRRDFATAPGPTAVAIQDMNADGLADLVTSNGRDGSVSHLIADGVGGFLEHVEYATGNQPASIVIADLNGDGKPDVVTANSASSTLSVNSGTHVGAMGVRTDIATPGSPVSLRLGDVDGDGHLDAAMALFDSNQVVVHLGDGAGGFRQRFVLPTAAGPLGLALGDLNVDGYRDLVVANATAGTVSTFMNNQHGGFGTRLDLAAGNAPTAVAIGHVIGDSLPDVVAVNQGSNTVSVFMGLGSGHFGSALQWNVGTTPRDVALGDLNLDGRLDILVASFNERAITVLLNSSGTGFLPAALHSLIGRNSAGIAAADLNGDHFLDVAVVNYGSASVSIRLGDGTGGFSGGTELPVGDGARAITIADLNADARPDIVTANGLGGTVSALLGDGHGVFTEHAEFAVGAGPWAVAAGDLFGAVDAPLAILTANFDARTLAVLHPRRHTSTSLSGLPSPSVAGDPVTLTATVGEADGAGPAPSGDVQFFDGSTLLGVAPLVGTVATLTTSALALGRRSVHAAYVGGPQWTGSASSEWATHVYRCTPAPFAWTATASAFEGDEIVLDVLGAPSATNVRFGSASSRLFTFAPTSYTPDSARIRLTVMIPAGAISGAVRVESPCGDVVTTNVLEVRRAFAFSTSRVESFGCLSGLGWPVTPALGDTMGVPLSALRLPGREDYDWRVRAWDPAAQDYRGVDRLLQGHGYWIQTRMPWQAAMTGAVVRDSTLLFPLLHRGWYLLGNPFPDAVPVANLRVLKRGIPRGFLRQTDVQPTVFVWDPLARRYQPTAQIPGGAMFWVRRLAPSTAESLLVPPPGAGVPEPPDPNADAAEWTARLHARQGDRLSDDVTIGVAALPGEAPHPRTALAPPPAPAGALSLSVRTPGTTGAEAYACLIADRREPLTWDLVIRGADAPGEIELLIELAGVPESACFELRDPASGLAETLAPGRPLTLAATEASRTLRLELRPVAEAGRLATAEHVRASPSPSSGATGFWFSHARDADLRVTLFDVAGRRVRALERRAAPAGESVLVWDGRDDQGRRLPAAVYFARCETAGRQSVLRVVRLP